MKSTIHSNHSPYHRRRLAAATALLLAGAGFVSAQSTTTSTDVNRSTNKPSGSYSANAAAGSASDSYNAGSSTYNSGTGSSDINNPHASASTTGAGAMTGRSSSSDKLSWGDRRFVTKAAEGGMAEIDVAKLATEKASNSEVKSFAQKLVDDHQMVATELEGIAAQKNVKLDDDNDHDHTYKKLSKKSGSDFDQEFVEHMIDEHEKDIKMFEKASEDAKDSDVKAFAAKHVDHLREHLKMAQDLKQTLMPTGRTDSSVTTRASTDSFDNSSSTSSSDSSKSKDYKANDDTTSKTPDRN